MFNNDNNLSFLIMRNGSTIKQIKSNLYIFIMGLSSPYGNYVGFTIMFLFV